MKKNIEVERGDLLSTARALMADAEVLAEQQASTLARLARVLAEIEASRGDRRHQAAIEPRLLTFGQAAAAMSVSQSTVKRMVRDGEIETVQLRGAPRIPIIEIENLAAIGEQRRGA